MASPKRVAVVDNYDSFTYNLVQYLEELGAECDVLKSDLTTPEEVERRMPRGVVISPGPGSPQASGVTVAVVLSLGGRIPVLGVCLGHQAIGVAFGATVRRASRPVHGRASSVDHSGTGIYEGVPSPFMAGRYHSLVLDEASLPASLEVTARSEGNDIMGVRHRHSPIEGVQFHPESVLTEHGKVLLANWVRTL